jgi:hypothetical protein
MNVKPMVAAAISIANQCLDYRAQLQEQSLRILNHLRQSMNPTPLNMSAVTWNEPLATAARDYLNIVGDDWVFKNNTDCPPFAGTYYSMAGSCLTQQPEMKLFNHCRFVIHDTEVGAFKIPAILSFRARQVSCFDYYSCSKTTYEGYKTCNKSKEFDTGRCRDFWQYIGSMVRDDLESVAIVPVNAKGTFSPKGQDCSFWVYGCGSGPTIPKNDIPYKAKSKLRI